MGILESLKSKTPTIWRKITKLAIAIKVGCISILGTNAVTPLPNDLVTAAGWALGICLIIVTYSETRVEKTSNSSSNTDNNPTNSQ